jgi:predicted SAM-dependent methyltransferase
MERLGNTLAHDLPDSTPSSQPMADRPTLRRRILDRVPDDRRFAVRYSLQHRYTSALRARETRRAKELARRSPLLLHLGCGPHRKDGWVNIDLAGHPVDLRWNLAHPLPFEAGSVDGIFHEHLLEHLPLATGLQFLQANYNLLRPGGVIRVVVPDAGAYLESYTRDGEGFLEGARPGRPTPMLAINELFYLYTHAAMYDAQTLTMFLRAVGFDNPEIKSQGASRLDPCPDSAHRASESLYVEAVK